MIARLARWPWSLPATMFYLIAARALHQESDSPSGVPALVALLAGWLASSTITLWMFIDAQRRGRPLPFSMGWLLFVGWSVLAPIYLFVTRGWRGWLPLISFGLLWLAAEMFTAAVIYLHR